MGALTENRMTPARDGNSRSGPIKADTTVYLGSMVGYDSDVIVPMSTKTGLVCLGRAESQVDNTGGADGDLDVPVGAGIYRYANSTSTDEITTAEIGSTCYAVDDQTVAKTDGSSARSAAGTVFDVDDDGVWVKFS